MPLQIIRDDITKVKADAIVNTANPKPTYGAGTDAAIYAAAGAEQLLAERRKIGDIARGEVAVTPAFSLNARYIIHTVGPSWKGGSDGEFDTLKSCYGNSLTKALELGCESIAFPLIATGEYGFPKAEALRIALDEIGRFLMRDDVEMTVRLVVFDEKAFRLSRSMFFGVESFITDEEVLKAHLREYAEDNRRSLSRRFLNEAGAREMHHVPAVQPLNEKTFDKSLYMVDKKDELSFRDHLVKFLNDRDIDNKTAYKRSNVTKGAFSKILCGDTKNPQKKTVLAFCIGLRLTLAESAELLSSADMAFNPGSKRDKLVMQCIETGQYDVDEVNAMLFVCGQPLLGY